MRRALLAVAGVVAFVVLLSARSAEAQQPRAYGQTWGGAYTSQEWGRFYHYPYVYYPQNFRGNEYYRSSNSLYHRYPPEMQIPVYNKKWHNYYPAGRRYHFGNHFRLDVF
ncbi:MAG: calmodulin-binding protein [Pirellulaceae bacterium]|nr:calmodulin-binding protein [Planctomycetaceae bacterium]HIM28882.1 calmodulin-binding protein [Planctomycetota bacterium]